jgi:DNA-binding GntR family transcriptional regulator
VELQVPTLSLVNIDQAVYTAIAEQIISGVLPPGARITEEEIAAKLGVSRTPVREAMKSLAKDELIELLPRRGAYVRRLGCDDIREIFEIREALEGMAANLATSRVTDEEIEILSARMEDSERDLAHGRAETWLEVDSALHSLVLDHCGNNRIRKTVHSLNNLVHYFRARVARDRNRAVDAMSEHRKMLTAFKQRDAEAAEAAMREHIRITRDRTLLDVDFGE